MAKRLSFDKGLVEYDINGDFTATFNPTDETFVAKLEAAVGSLDGMQDSLVGESFSEFGALDADMRSVIDDLLGDGAAGALFPDMNCYALSGGLPVWMNLMFALLDEVSDAYEREFGKTDERVKAVNAKYEAMMRKYRKDGK